jgi:AraC-like DNA-binding protein
METMQLMNERSFAVHTPDVDRVRELVGKLFCPFRLSARPVPYDARLRHDPLGLLSFTTIEYGNPVEIDVGDRQPRFLLQIALAGAFDARTTGGEVRGSPVSAQVVRAKTPLHMRCTADCRMLVISGNALDLEVQARALAGDDIDFPGALPDVVPLTGAGASLGRCIEFLYAESQRTDSLLRVGCGSGPAGQMLLALLLRSVHTRERPTRSGRAWYVKRAEAFMEANLGNHIGIADVVASAGVSVRALCYGFHACHGVGPMTWLKRRRLERARDELAAASPAETNVTQVALRWAFLHLGRFAADYRARFGEPPSQTLRRG